MHEFLEFGTELTEKEILISFYNLFFLYFIWDIIKFLFQFIHGRVRSTVNKYFR